MVQKRVFNSSKIRIILNNNLKHVISIIVTLNINYIKIINVVSFIFELTEISFYLISLLKN